MLLLFAHQQNLTNRHICVTTNDNVFFIYFYFCISFSYIKFSITAQSDYSCCCNNLINYFNITECNIIPANISISLMRIIETATKLDSRNITISVVNFLSSLRPINESYSHTKQPNARHIDTPCIIIWYYWYQKSDNLKCVRYWIEKWRDDRDE